MPLWEEIATATSAGQNYNHANHYSPNTLEVLTGNFMWIYYNKEIYY